MYDRGLFDHMDSITPDMKVAEVVERHPQTTEVFFDYGCPDMRGGIFGFMARLMSVRSAARIHRIPLGALIADLNAAAEWQERSEKQKGGEQSPA